VGTDLSLYGYGLGLSFLFSKQLGRDVLSCVPPNGFPIFIVVALFLTMIIYLVTLRLSQRIRRMQKGKYSDGIDNWRELRAVLRESAGRRNMSWSLALGFLPTIVLVMLDMVPR
jgi:hypothetical protein